MRMHLIAFLFKCPEYHENILQKMQHNRTKGIQFSRSRQSVRVEPNTVFDTMHRDQQMTGNSL